MEEKGTNRQVIPDMFGLFLILCSMFFVAGIGLMTKIVRCFRWRRNCHSSHRARPRP